jgi:flagellar basal-body rod protein FlgF/flagellar basal-body rod protein FlgG
MEVLANNLANVDTVGFKRQFAVLQARASEAIRQGLATMGDGSVSDVGGGVEVPQTLTDFSPGTLKQTGEATDLAIDGEGFFVVQGEAGERLLTRAGDFQLTSEGLLTTQDGQPVLSQDNTPVQLNPLAPFNVGDDGTVFQLGEAIPLAIVKPQFPADLVQRGVNTFRSLSEVTALEPGERQVRSGYLEMSGVTPTTEMMEMIEASRAFESNVRLIQQQDQAIGNLLSRVLRS